MNFLRLFFKRNIQTAVIMKNTQLRILNLRGHNFIFLPEGIGKLSRLFTSCAVPETYKSLLDNPIIEKYMSKIAEELDESQTSKKELSYTFSLWQERKKLITDLQALDSLTSDASNKELVSLAAEEKLDLEEKMVHVDQEILNAILPDDIHSDLDENSLVLEITAGVGGQEAMIFAAELLDMYQRYFVYRGWEHDEAELDTSELGGLRHGTLSVVGDGAFTEMRHEGGVHRVQRVPKTEKSGRVHTSTVTVAILPQPTQVAITLPPKDLKIETKRSSGAGGQHVNTTDSCVRIIHLPTGLVVECQTERSQVQNKIKAINWLRARLYQRKLEQQQLERRDSRRQQVGLSLRSEKIRTYNFPQDRITDHRVGVTFHNLKGFLDGGANLGELLSKLADHERRLQMRAFIQSLAEK